MKDPDIILRMQAQTRQWIESDDRRSVFLECYTLMTGNMLRAIKAGQFHDGRWAKQLLLRFADYYFLALENYEHEQRHCAAVWCFTHDCTRSKPLHVLQQLLLGINAHINYDLVLSLVDLLESEWELLGETDRQRRYEDHCRVNEVIAATIDTVQDTVVERYDPRMDIIDHLLGRLDERLLSKLISGWRQHVWEEAMQFIATAPDQREALRLALEVAVMKRARRMVIL